jgi:flagellar hook-basal body complex protein FliE
MMVGAGEPVAAIETLGASSVPLRNALLITSGPQSFGDALASAVDSLSNALVDADDLAVSAVAKKADIADAAIARAKADVMLEVAAIASAKVSGAIAQLLQTQL